MNQMGKVISVKMKTALVEVERQSACQDCKGCRFGTDEGKLTVDAVNDVNAVTGDLVEINLCTTNILKASVIVYLIPLIMLILGVIVGYLLSGFLGVDKGIMGAVFGIVFTAFSFLAIRHYEPKLKKQDDYIPSIVKIIRKEGD